ncbi:hypothetical protein PINS_up005079 [Pythium insidiosum]|nr:hypothetical protein PINS_up005079 [Pythium insidiosum]
MSYFRSLLEAAMGDDEMPAHIEEYEEAVAASGLGDDPDMEASSGGGAEQTRGRARRRGTGPVIATFFVG